MNANAHGIATITSTGLSRMQAVERFSMFEDRKLPSWKPRAGKAGHAAWRERLGDLDCDERINGQIAMTLKGPPTIDEVCFSFSGLGYSPAEIAALFVKARKEYDTFNTKLYMLVRESLDLSGPHNADDMRTIAKLCHIGVQHRDGAALIKWAESLIDVTGLQEQTELRIKVDTMKLIATPNLDQLALHANELLRNWSLIHGNSPSIPMAFYHRLLSSLPVSGASTTMIEIRKWLIDHTESAQRPYFHDPELLVSKMIEFATKMGMPTSGRGAVLQVNGQQKNDCKLCDAYFCQSNKKGGAKKCVTMNKEARTATLMKSLSPGAKRFLLGADTYVKANPGITTLKGVKFDIPKAGDGSNSAPNVHAIIDGDHDLPEDCCYVLNGDPLISAPHEFIDWLCGVGIPAKLTSLPESSLANYIEATQSTGVEMLNQFSCGLNQAEFELPDTADSVVHTQPCVSAVVDEVDPSEVIEALSEDLQRLRLNESGQPLHEEHQQQVDEVTAVLRDKGLMTDPNEPTPESEQMLATANKLLVPHGCSALSLLKSRMGSFTNAVHGALVTGAGGADHGVGGVENAQSKPTKSTPISAEEYVALARVQQEKEVRRLKDKILTLECKSSLPSLIIKTITGGFSSTLKALASCPRSTIVACLITTFVWPRIKHKVKWSSSAMLTYIGRLIYLSYKDSDRKLAWVLRKIIMAINLWINMLEIKSTSTDNEGGNEPDGQGSASAVDAVDHNVIQPVESQPQPDNVKIETALKPDEQIDYEVSWNRSRTIRDAESNDAPSAHLVFFHAELSMSRKCGGGSGGGGGSYKQPQKCLCNAGAWGSCSRPATANGYCNHCGPDDACDCVLCEVEGDKCKCNMQITSSNAPLTCPVMDDDDIILFGEGLSQINGDTHQQFLMDNRPQIDAGGFDDRAHDPNYPWRDRLPPLDGHPISLHDSERITQRRMVESGNGDTFVPILPYLVAATNNLEAILADPCGAVCVHCYFAPRVTVDTECKDISTVICPICEVDAMIPRSSLEADTLHSDLFRWHTMAFGEQSAYDAATCSFMQAMSLEQPCDADNVDDDHYRENEFVMPIIVPDNDPARLHFTVLPEGTSTAPGVEQLWSLLGQREWTDWYYRGACMCPLAILNGNFCRNSVEPNGYYADVVQTGVLVVESHSTALPTTYAQRLELVTSSRFRDFIQDKLCDWCYGCTAYNSNTREFTFDCHCDCTHACGVPNVEQQPAVEQSAMANGDAHGPHENPDLINARRSGVVGGAICDRSPWSIMVQDDVVYQSMNEVNDVSRSDSLICRDCDFNTSSCCTFHSRNRHLRAVEKGLGVCPSNPHGNSASHSLSPLLELVQTGINGTDWHEANEVSLPKVNRLMTQWEENYLAPRVARVAICNGLHWYYYTEYRAIDIQRVWRGYQLRTSHSFNSAYHASFHTTTMQHDTVMMMNSGRGHRDGRNGRGGRGGGRGGRGAHGHIASSFSSNSLVAAMLPGEKSILCDSGATVNCFKTTMGQIPGTKKKWEGPPLQVGDEDSKLHSSYTSLHAITRVDSEGVEHDAIVTAHYTPNCVVNILSEPDEVSTRGTEIHWDLSGRVYNLKEGFSLRLLQTDNGLGWLKIKPITDRERIRELIKSSLLIMDVDHSSRDEVNNLLMMMGPELVMRIGSERIRSEVYLSLADDGMAAAVVNPDLIKAGIGIGSYKAITGLELLRRMHVCLGHASFDDTIMTVKRVASLRGGKITDEDIQTFKKSGCGICETVKMVRRPFTGHTGDKTLPPIGTVWTFDTLSLRVPTAEYGNMALTTFVDRTSKKSITFPHKRQTTDEFNKLGLKLRAFVRPFHGEIKVMRHDGHPSLTGHRFEDFTSESQVSDDCAPPYVHEYSSDAEIVWRNGVPATMALLLGCSSNRQVNNERHIDTAFHCWERGRDVLKDKDGKSRHELFYGSESISYPLMMAYGSPVKALLHPEIRDSKFDDHAFEAVYRGPSPDNASSTSCLVSYGHGATLRHCTVDIGCMRIDERAVIARIDREHPMHQSHAIDPASDPVGTNHQGWHHPAYDSRVGQIIWTPSTPLPTFEFAVYYCGGDGSNDNSLRQAFIRRFGVAAAPQVIILDRDLGGYSHDLTRVEVQDAGCGLCMHDKCVFAVLTFPCSPWSVKLFDAPGPTPIFRRGFVDGIETNDPTIRSRIDAAMSLCEYGVRIASVMISRERVFIWETAAGHGAGTSRPMPGKEDHTAMFDTTPIQTFIKSASLKVIIGDRSPFGCPQRKTTAYLSNAQEAAERELSKFDNSSTFEKTPSGRDASGKYNTAQMGVLEPALYDAFVRIFESGSSLTSTAREVPESTAGATEGDYDVRADSHVPQPHNTEEPMDMREEPYESTVPSQPITGKRGRDENEEVEPELLPASLTRPRRVQSDQRYTADGKKAFTIFQHSGTDDGSSIFTVEVDTVINGHSVIDELTLAWLDERVGCSTRSNLVASLANDDTHDGYHDDGIVAHFNTRANAAAILSISERHSHPTVIEEEIVVGAHAEVTVQLNAWDVETGESYAPLLTYAILNGEQHLVFAVNKGSDPLDTTYASSWHTPKNEREYDRSPQRALWRTAKETKMDEYRAIPLFKLVPVQWVVDNGYKIMGSTWAYKISTDKDGQFVKLNPRWCVMGGDMDRDVFQSFNEVMLKVTLRIFANIRACVPGVIDFQFDMTNAFQKTPATDEAFESSPLPKPTRSKPLPRLFCQQARGFVEYGPNGERMCCEILMAHQGRCDASKLHGDVVHKILVEHLKYKKSSWDPKLYTLHSGPAADNCDDLSELLKKCALASTSAAPGTPPGFGAVGLHVDDGIGLASSQAIIDYTRGGIEVGYVCKFTGWMKFLGWGITIDDTLHTVEFDAIPTVKKLMAEHVGTDHAITPRMPYLTTFTAVEAGQVPEEGSPERADYLSMQSKCRSLLGAGIWLSDCYPQIMMPNNYQCQHMSNPSKECYKHSKIWLMHLNAHPVPIRHGGSLAYGKDLTLSSEFIMPFTPGKKELGYHQFSDANLGTEYHFKAISSHVDMWAGSAIGTGSQRQHLIAPDSHTAEVTSAGTGLHRIIPTRGILQEMHIPQIAPTPQCLDSITTTFVAQSEGAVKRSVWIRRRAAVLQEGCEMGDMHPYHIPEYDMVADGYNKGVQFDIYLRHLHYSHNLPGEPPPRRKVSLGEGSQSAGNESAKNAAP